MASMTEAGNAAIDFSKLTVRRVLKAPRERVFEAFTDAGALQRWWGPRGMRAQDPRVDLRVGGAFHLDMRSDAGDVYKLSGRYREIKRPSRLVFSWAWAQGPMANHETEVTLEFREHPDGTELVLVHSGFPTANDREMHNQGWESSVDCLAEALVPGAAGKA